MLKINKCSVELLTDFVYSLEIYVSDFTVV
jgi:hypothetical protein